MASTVRITPGGSGGGEPPSDEPPGGDKPGTRPEGAANEDRASTAPTTERTPLASGATAAPAAPSVEVVPAPAVTVHGTPDSAALLLDSPADRPSASGPANGAPSAPPPATPGGRPQCPECGERFSRGSRFCAFDGTRLVETTEDVASDPLIGQTLGGKYTVVRAIGEGGMGTVYEVRHTALDRRFALKILRPEISQNGEHIQRFLQEAKAAAAIGHPNIVSVSDFGEHVVRGRSVPFIVMELLRGTSLAALLKEEKVLSPRRAAHILADCAEALSAAHEAGVIHRDLKPDNIFLSGDQGDVVKVLDFGVAKMQGASSKRLTKVGMVFGTPHYMSPEQARGQTIDHRADIYALGVILYECLSGHVPFEADTSMGVLTKQIFANPEPIERVAPDPSRLGNLGDIVMRCLAKEPDDRYGTMLELAEALRMTIRYPAAASLGAGSGRHKRAALRLREETAMPRPAPSKAEPTPSNWTRFVVLAAAGVAVLGLLAVLSRALLSGAGPDPAAGVHGSGAPPSTATTIAGPAGPPSAAPVVTGSEATASTPAQGGAASPSTAAGSTSGAAGAGAAGAASSPSGRSTSPSTTSSQAPAKSSSNDVVDPWSRPTKKPPPTTTGVVDPWSSKKK